VEFGVLNTHRAVGTTLSHEVGGACPWPGFPAADGAAVVDWCERPSRALWCGVAHNIPTTPTHLCPASAPKHTHNQTPNQVTKRFGASGLPDDTIHVKLSGHAGQSLGAWLCKVGGVWWCESSGAGALGFSFFLSGFSFISRRTTLCMQCIPR
jgi:hypothetical protein